MQTVNNVRDHIYSHELIKPGQVVLVGLSGGADSVFLLYALSELRASMDFSLYALHVNHGIRGEEAKRDEAFSEKTAEQLHVDFKSVYIDVPEIAAKFGLGLEEAGRIERYKALRAYKSELMEKTGRECVIAVAHHADDQAETVLHNMFRGTGLRGIGGMSDKSGDIIRPLLPIRKEEILESLEAAELSYMTDSTNTDTEYTRNLIRLEMIPLAEKINQQAVSHIGSAAEFALEAADYFTEYASGFLDEQAVCEDRAITLPLQKLRLEKPIIRKYIYMELIKRLGTPLKDWGQRHFTDIDKLIWNGNGAHLDLPYKMSADIVKKTLCVKVNEEVISMKRRKKPC